MPLVASDSASTPRTLAPAGTHIARCVQLVDLGTQDDSYEGKAKLSHKVRITWELPFEQHVFEEEKGEQPFFVTKKYTLNLGEKSNLRKDLVSWRGRDFTEDELRGFDLKNILGAACQVSIIHTKGKTSGKMREDVTAVTPLAKGMQCPPAISPMVYFEVAMGQNEVYNALPKFLQEDIAKCHEWRNQESREPSGGPQFSEPGSTLDDDEDPEIPF